MVTGILDEYNMTDDRAYDMMLLFLCSLSLKFWLAFPFNESGIWKVCKMFCNAFTRPAIVSIHFATLFVAVAKRSRLRVHQISQLDTFRRIHSKIDDIFKGSVATWRRVVDGDGVSDLMYSVCGILILPDPPDSVNLGVLKVPPWVAGTGKEITSWVATDEEVAAGVYA